MADGLPHTALGPITANPVKKISVPALVAHAINLTIAQAVSHVL